MALYAIFLNEPSDDEWAQVREAWQTHHIFDDRLAFISADNALTAEVAKASGIGADDASGIVIQMDFYSGHTSTSLVEWISKHHG